MKHYCLYNKTYSRRLSKIIVDFAAESPFRQAVARIKDHYDLIIPVSSAKIITEGMAKSAKKILQSPKTFKQGTFSECKRMITEVDGGMVPIVERCEAVQDKRKAKSAYWKELRVGVQQRHNEVDWKYSVGFSIDDIEKQMRRMARVLGVNNKTNVHCIGDGAVWIKELTDRIYGKKASYLVDFFHMAEYLYQASELCGDGARDIWFAHAQERMKTGRQEEVMVDLTTAHSIDPSHRGVAECRRYMQNRVGQFRYQEALIEGLPIGSGKVESSHRTLIQSRLKLAGMWWRQDNAENMAYLRALRANTMWDLLWAKPDRYSEPPIKAAA